MESEKGYENFGSCVTCSGRTFSRAITLSKMFERLVPTTADEAMTTGCGWSGVVSNAESIGSYCNMACWRRDEGKVREAWQIRYKSDAELPMCRCSRCGKVFDGQAPHLLLTLSDDEAAEDGFSITCHWANDIATFCPSCKMQFATMGRDVETPREVEV
jgi:hypothetical protein